MLRTPFALVSILLLVSFAACSGGGQESPDATPITACNDGVDNDGDMSTDYPADPGCANELDNDESNAPIAMCADGRDNDADGKTDYPNDPGCVSALENSEADDCPTGPNCPACSNGVDDDGDTLVDYPMDSGCLSASHDDEYVTNPAACGTGLIVTRLDVDTATDMFITAGDSHLQGSCGGVGSEVVYELVLQDPMVIIATTEDPATTGNTVMYLRDDCMDPTTELACNDDIEPGVNRASAITYSLDAGVYYLIIDNHDQITAGAFTLHVERLAGEGVPCTTTAGCGPGLVCRIPMGGTEMVCSNPVCSDGLDDDSDGTPDFPGDPGCDSLTDADETDDCPAGPNCPECGNDLDDDGDSLTDYPDDPDCVSASQAVEGCAPENDPIFTLDEATETGDLTGLTDDFDLECDSTGGLDRVYFVTLPAMQQIRFDTETSVTDTVLSLLPSNCTGAALGCDDDGGVGAGDSLLTLNNVPAGSYALVIENYSTSFPPGPYELHTTGIIALGGACTGALATAGVISCDTANGYTCNGSGICAGTLQCNNGVDDDGDGDVDYPNDPGCASLADNDETDDCPSGPTCPECSNGIDDDGDGQTDYPADGGCDAAGDAELCGIESDPFFTLDEATETGNLTGLTDNFDLSCDGTGGLERVYFLTVPQMQQLRFDTETSVTDTVLSLFTAGCEGAALGCDNDGGVGVGDSLLTVNNVPAGNYALVIGNYSTAFPPGAYELHSSGIIVAGGNCSGALATAGVIGCDTAGGYTCVGGTCTATGQCINTIDEDGDGFAGYPTDPGCTSPGDPDETDDCPSGPSCPQCANDLDDDGDLAIDYPMDTSCTSASGAFESCPPVDTEPTLPITAQTTNGTTIGAVGDFIATCQSNSGSPDVSYSLTLPVGVTSLAADTNNSGWDTVLTLRTADCVMPVISCDDDSGTPGNESSLTATNLAAGTYFFIVDGWNGQSNPFALHVTGVAVAGASCTSPLFAAGVLTCAVGETCTAGTCQ